MIVTRSIRRFRQGQDQRTELVRVLEFPVVPVKGMTVDFGDNSGEAVVAHVRVRLRSWGPGLHPAALEVRFDSEPGERMEGAVTAGWTPLEPVTTAPTAPAQAS